MSSSATPWDRQDGETPKAFRAWIAYRDQGPARTLQQVAVLLKRKPEYRRQLSRWAARYDWHSRASAWDDHLQSARNEVIVDHVREAQAELQARLPDLTRRLLEIALGRQTPPEPDGAEPPPFTGAHARILLGAIDRAGLPSVRRVDHTSAGEPLGRSVDLSRLSDDALAELAAVVGADDGEDDDSA